MAHIHLPHQDSRVLFCTFFPADWTLPHTGARSCSSPGSLDFPLLTFRRLPSDNSSVKVPLDVSTSLFGLSASAASLLRAHLCVTPQVSNEGVKQDWLWYWVPGYTASGCTPVFEPLVTLALMPTNLSSPSGQTVSSCFHCSPTWHALRHFVYKDAMGDHAESLTEVKINNVHCSALFNPANLITQGG